jgi:hypothetical protein
LPKGAAPKPISVIEISAPEGALNRRFFIILVPQHCCVYRRLRL